MSPIVHKLQTNLSKVSSLVQWQFKFTLIQTLKLTEPRDPITIINDIRSLLTQANTTYVNQNFTGAEELVRTAYLDHYEFLEVPLGVFNPGLMESTELLLREDLISAIQQRASVSDVQSLMTTINNNLNEAELLFQ